MKITLAISRAFAKHLQIVMHELGQSGTSESAYRFQDIYEQIGEQLKPRKKSNAPRSK
jgi:hypothetical protein